MSVTLIKGDRGIFQVRTSGDVVYSKKECGDRFPTTAEIVAALRARPGASAD